MKIIKQ